MRIEGIDTAKGVALVMVMGVHAGWPDVVTLWGIGVRLPVFFVIAGMFLKPEARWIDFLRNKLRRLIIPFLFFLLLGLLIYLVGKTVIDSGAQLDFSLFNVFSVEPRHLTYPAAIWFFPAIFWCMAMMMAVCHAVRREIYRALLCMGLGIGGWVLSGRMVLPLWLDTSMSCMPLVYCGYAVRKYLFGKITSGRYWLLSVLVVVVCCGIYHYEGFRAGYCYNLYKGLVPAIIVLAAIASTGFISVCCRIGSLPLFGYIGRNSLVIFGIHQHVMILLAPLALPWLPLLLATVSGSVVSGWLLKRYLPACVGERGGIIRRNMKSKGVTI